MLTLLALALLAYLALAAAFYILIENASGWRCLAWGVILPYGAFMDLVGWVRGRR